MTVALLESADAPIASLALSANAQLAVLTPELPHGAAAVFTVRATDRARHSASASVQCLVSAVPPPPGSLSIEAAVSLVDAGFLQKRRGLRELGGRFLDDAGYVRARVVAMDPARASGARLCWAGFDADDAAVPIAHYLVWTLALTDASESTSAADLRSAATPGNAIQFDADARCADDSSPLAGEAGVYLLRVAAVSTSLLQSEVAELLLVVDDTPPSAAEGGVRIHTNTNSRYQSSDCCLRLSWQPWVEVETSVSRYVLCDVDYTPITALSPAMPLALPPSCLDVADSVQVLIAAHDSCGCDPPRGSNGSAWSQHVHRLALADDTGPSSFTVTAVNVLGLSSTVGPYTVKCHGMK